jgi:hypothetical protein
MFRSAVVVVIALLTLSVVHGQGPDGKEPGDIDAKVVDAWTKAGAKPGWMAADNKGPTFSPERPKGMLAVPAFRPEGGSLPALKDLPLPQVPFGLDLSDLAVTDGDMKAVARFPKLHTLDLFNAKITDAGLKELAANQQLQQLFLDGTTVGDAGVKALGGLKQMRALNLYGTKVSDASMKEVGAMKELVMLDLGSTQVGDAGLKELAGLTRLESLLLDGTRVTNAGVEALRKALPKCKIDTDKK